MIGGIPIPNITYHIKDSLELEIINEGGTGRITLFTKEEVNSKYAFLSVSVGTSPSADGLNNIQTTTYTHKDVFSIPEPAKQFSWVIGNQVSTVLDEVNTVIAKQGSLVNKALKFTAEVTEHLGTSISNMLHITRAEAGSMGLDFRYMFFNKVITNTNQNNFIVIHFDKLAESNAFIEIYPIVQKLKTVFINNFGNGPRYKIRKSSINSNKQKYFPFATGWFYVEELHVQLREYDYAAEFLAQHNIKTVTPELIAFYKRITVTIKLRPATIYYKTISPQDLLI